MKPLDLTRTAAALDAYDAFDARLDFDGKSQEEILAGLAELERLGEAVGEAFGLDTADRNKLDDCRRYVRPGHRDPGDGADHSFVRRMVARWRQEVAQ